MDGDSDVEKLNIPTVVKLIDDDEIIEMLAEETRNRHMYGRAAFVAVINPANDSIIAAEMEQERAASIDRRYADERASLARTELKQTIADAGAVLGSARLASIMNFATSTLRTRSKPPAARRTDLSSR